MKSATAKTLLIGTATAALLGLGMANANASVISHFSDATDVAIPDNTYDGSLGSMVSSTINVAGGLGSIELVTLSFTMSHSWVGDLSIKLTRVC
jgi:subtilisin-like proprotein convertase family protein